MATVGLNDGGRPMESLAGEQETHAEGRREVERLTQISRLAQ
jgi:hypothetical protein